ncbi:MAG: radical SAM protein [Pseudomonadota bacterium]
MTEKSPNRLAVEFPWCFGDIQTIRITLLDPAMAGSAGHFIRLDVYPLFSPSHPERHMAYFDLNLGQVKENNLTLSLEKGRLSFVSDKGLIDVPAVWEGSIPFSGYCRMTLSLWSITNGNAEQIETRSSSPLLLKGTGGQPLEWLQVAVTDKCNLRCPMCSRQRGLDCSEADVSDDVLNPLLDAAPGIIFLGLQGLGEPLMHSDLPGLVKAFRKRMPPLGRIGITTNGTLLNRSYAQRLVDAGVNTFTFSVDGASKKVYEALRTGARFEQVMANIRSTVDCARESGRKDVWVCSNFTMGMENLSQVADFAKLGVSLGLDAVHFFHGREYPDMRLTRLDDALLARVTREALDMGEAAGMVIHFAHSKASSSPRCPFMTNAYMWITGEVTPCQRMEPPGKPWPTRILGNVKDKPLMEIWNQEESREFRRGVLGGNYPSECRGCTFCDSVVC